MERDVESILQKFSLGVFHLKDKIHFENMKRVNIREFVIFMLLIVQI